MTKNNPISILSKAAYAAPLVPSILIGWAVYESADEITVTFLRIAASVAFAVAFEGAGVLAGQLNNKRFLAAYIGLGIATLISLEFFDVAQLVVGIAALLVAALVYIVMGENQRETIDRVDSRQQAKMSMELEHEIKLARIAANRDVKIARVDVKQPVKVSSQPVKVDKPSYSALTHDDKLTLLDMSALQIASSYGVSRQTATSWRRKAQANGAQP